MEAQLHGKTESVYKSEQETLSDSIIKFIVTLRVSNYLYPSDVELP